MSMVSLNELLATADTCVAVPEVRGDGTYQKACAALVVRIESTFKALCGAFKRGPMAISEVNAHARRLGELETEYARMTGNTRICK